MITINLNYKPFRWLLKRYAETELCQLMGKKDTFFTQYFESEQSPVDITSFQHFELINWRDLYHKSRVNGLFKAECKELTKGRKSSLLDWLSTTIMHGGWDYLFNVYDFYLRCKTFDVVRDKTEEEIADWFFNMYIDLYARWGQEPLSWWWEFETLTFLDFEILCHLDKSALKEWGNIPSKYDTILDSILDGTYEYTIVV